MNAMHNLYKVIVCDLDNTLVNSKKQLSEKTIQYLLSLQDKGYLLVLASGRFIHEIEPVAQDLQIKEHHGMIIACNGFEIYDYRDDSYHQFTAIDADEASALIETARKKHCSTYLFEHDAYYFIQTKMMKPLLKIAECLFPLLKRMHPKLGHAIHRYHRMKILDQAPIFQQSFQKLCFISHKPKHIIHLQDTIARQYPNQYQFFYENPLVTEIAKCDVSKMHAVKYLCNKYQYDMKEVIAFGDNGNDLLLLEAAGLGVTMKNASRYIRKQANHITDKTCDEDGVIEYLKTLNL